MTITLKSPTDELDEALRRRARENGVTVDQAVMTILRREFDLPERDAEGRYRDLDDLAGTWEEDPEFDAIIRAIDTVDPEMWK